MESISKIHTFDLLIISVEQFNVCNEIIPISNSIHFSSISSITSSNVFVQQHFSIFFFNLPLKKPIIPDRNFSYIPVRIISILIQLIQYTNKVSWTFVILFFIDLFNGLLNNLHSIVLGIIVYRLHFVNCVFF